MGKCIPIYNEFALQFELAFFLRERLKGERKVQLERNISFLGLTKSAFLKKEIDILVFRSIDTLADTAIVELKAIINQKIARPINIYHWVEDLKFLEQLKAAGVGQCISLFITDNQQLLTPQTKLRANSSLPLLPDFRARRVQGTYSTHGSENTNNKWVSLAEEYTFEWKDYLKGQRYFHIAV